MAIPANKKICPDCAEQVNLHARVCLKCGYRFERKPLQLTAVALANPVVVISLIGAAAFVGTRLAQTTFYSRFGLEPEDVGLTYTETLTRAAVALVVLCVVPVFIALIVWSIIRLYASPEPRVSRRSALMRQAFSALAGAAAVLLVAFVADTYKARALDVKNGMPMRPAGITWDFIENPLALRAERVGVSWIDDTKEGYAFDKGDVMYLGRAAGVAVFYDPHSDRTVRIPDTGSVIERRDT